MGFSNYEVCNRYFLDKKSSTGGHIYHDSNYIYSYGHHYPLAWKDKKNKIAYINSVKYSVSTSRHKWDAAQAARTNGYRVIFLYDGLTNSDNYKPNYDLARAGQWLINEYMIWKLKADKSKKLNTLKFYKDMMKETREELKIYWPYVLKNHSKTLKRYNEDKAQADSLLELQEIMELIKTHKNNIKQMKTIMGRR